MARDQAVREEDPQVGLLVKAVVDRLSSDGFRADIPPFGFYVLKESVHKRGDYCFPPLQALFGGKFLIRIFQTEDPVDL
jgi:hypothetical protein